MIERREFKPLRFWSNKQAREDTALMKSVVGQTGTYEYPLPTECVIYPNGRLPSIRTARIYYASAEHGCDRGDGWEACRLIVEVCEDRRDDGHTDYDIVGYALMSMHMCGEFSEAARASTSTYDYPHILVQQEVKEGDDGTAADV